MTKTILSGQFLPSSLLGLSSHLIATVTHLLQRAQNPRTFTDDDAFDVTGNRCGDRRFHLKRVRSDDENKNAQRLLTFMALRTRGGWWMNNVRM